MERPLSILPFLGSIGHFVWIFEKPSVRYTHHASKRKRRNKETITVKDTQTIFISDWTSVSLAFLICFIKIYPKEKNSQEKHQFQNYRIRIKNKILTIASAKWFFISLNKSFDEKKMMMKTPYDVRVNRID